MSNDSRLVGTINDKSINLKEIVVFYNFRLMNGNPMTHHRSSFLHQFSSDEQDLLQVYLGLFVMYCILTPLQLHATQKQVHPIAKLLALGRTLQHLSVLHKMFSM